LILSEHCLTFEIKDFFSFVFNFYKMAPDLLGFNLMNSGSLKVSCFSPNTGMQVGDQIEGGAEVKKKTLCGIGAILSSAVIAASSITAMAADVDVYAEGAYTDTDLVVYIYANITGDPLVSAGVQLPYDNTKLTLTSAVKNTDDWYFGTTSVKYPYQDPQDTGSSVVFICGKIDEGNPTAGVTGARKLIGKATFIRTDSTDPGTSPEAYFGSTSLGLGVIRTDGEVFANFVTAGEAVLDNTASLDMTSVIIRERGDANADHLITNSDYFAAKTLITTGIYKVYADCNADNLITNSDFFCIKSLM